MNREDILEIALNSDADIRGLFQRKVRVGRFSPDFIYNMPTMSIIIECDEWNHTDKHDYDEFVRILKMQRIIRKPIIVFRLASDCITNFHYNRYGGYGGKGKSIRFIFRKSRFITRIDRLIKMIKCCLANDVFAGDTTTKIILYYLYYTPNTPIVRYDVKKNIDEFIAAIRQELNEKNITENDKFDDINRKCIIKPEIIEDILIDIKYR